MFRSYISRLIVVVILIEMTALCQQQHDNLPPLVQSPPILFPTIRRNFDDTANCKYDYYVTNNIFMVVSSCAMGWKALASPDDDNYEYCVRIFSNLRMTWIQAEETCTHYSNAHLASFNSDRQLQYLDAIVSL
jgi:hypothetical protein